jgi:hypothetical protein
VRQALNAIEHPGENLTVARLAFIREGQFLHLQLPSGRRIRYPYVRVYAGERDKTFTFRDASGGRWEWYHVLKQGPRRLWRPCCRECHASAVPRYLRRSHAST